MNAAVDPTTIGAFATIILAFLGIAKIMLNQATKDRESDRHERLRLANAIEKMADPKVNGNERIASGIEKQARESEKRNGHLGELIIQSGEQTQAIADKAVETIITSVQHVEKQEVDTQTIKNKE